MTEIKTNLKWAAVFVALLAFSAAIILIHEKHVPNAKTAKIIQNGEVIQTVDLENVSEPYEFIVTNESGGENTIRVENGKIAVVHANCPDKICVNRGFIENSTFPIVCLPNKLSVVITNDKGSDIDAVAGGDMQ